jgi:enoyl-[acyl-carrier-protein] reductase (NADH)
VAKVVALLLSDGAAYMTGQIVHICGGLSVGALLE